MAAACTGSSTPPRGALELTTPGLRSSPDLSRDHTSARVLSGTELRSPALNSFPPRSLLVLLLKYVNHPSQTRGRRAQQEVLSNSYSAASWSTGLGLAWEESVVCCSGMPPRTLRV